MESTLLGKVPLDVLLLIMKSVPDFGTLNSLIRSGKTFHHLWKTNEYGICGPVSKKHFGPLWDDAHRLLLFQWELKRDSENEWDIRKLFGPTNDDKEQEHVGIGILSGGTNVGITESVELLKYAEKIDLGEGKLMLQVQETGEYVYSYASADIMRTDRALLRLWLLLLACGPYWVEMRAELLYRSRRVPLSGHLANTVETHINLSRGQINTNRFLCYSLSELEDMYTTSSAAWYIWSEFPGTIKQGGGHYWEVWGERDNMGVQLKAEMYLWNKIVEARGALAEVR